MKLEDFIEKVGEDETVLISDTVWDTMSYLSLEPLNFYNKEKHTLIKLFRNVEVVKISTWGKELHVTVNFTETLIENLDLVIEGLTDFYSDAAYEEIVEEFRKNEHFIEWLIVDFDLFADIYFQ